jgi:hypothetical protein
VIKKENLLNRVNQLVAFIHTLPSFQLSNTYDVPYNHMGATITDAVLQAGIVYDTVVRPRVEHIRQSYPEASTPNGFLKLVAEKSAENVLKWNHPEKPARAVALATFFQAEGIETEGDLSNWLAIDENLPRLLEIRGIGPKTVDYLKILTGMNTAAVDRHMYTFLKEAGIQVQGYDDAKALLNATADEMGIYRPALDYSIWRYMSTKSKRKKKKFALKSKNVTASI